MSSGKVLLSVRGREDAILTGEPQASYFFKRYARKEPYEILFVDNSLETTDVTYGSTLLFRVPRRGDLLSKIFLKIVFPPSYLYSNLIRAKTDTFALYSIIEDVDLIIGGQLVERLTGEFIHNYLKMTLSPNELVAMEETTEMKIRDLKKSYANFGQFALLPIPFYFFDKKGQEIPLVGITRHNVEVRIKLAERPPIEGLPDLQDVTVSTEYILLGSEQTKNLFRSRGILYRIEQLQLNSVVATPAETSKTLELDFQNPVRELFVCIQPRQFQQLIGGNYYNFFCNYRNSAVSQRNTTAGYYLSEHHITDMTLQLNEHKIVELDASMLCNQIPQKFYKNADNIQLFRGYAYPFVTDPQSLHPKGHLNMSRILKKRLKFSMNASNFTRNIRVYGKSYNTMMVRDGLAGLMFSNPSYYNPKIIEGEDEEITEGELPTDLPVLTEDQGYYYAIKVDDGYDVVAAQLYEQASPVFPSSKDLHDNEFTYLMNTTDTFLSNTVATNTAEYSPGTISQMLRTVVEIPNEEDAAAVEKYSVSSNNYIFTSNYGFAKHLRISVKTNGKVNVPTTASLDFIPDRDLLDLPTTVNISLYRSRTFFDPTDVAGWISSAEVDTQSIRLDRAEESTEYYYAARPSPVLGEALYTKVNYAKTFDISYFLNVVVPTEDVFDEGTNESFLTFTVNNLGDTSGVIYLLLGAQGIKTQVSYSVSDQSKSFTYQEEGVRGLKTYTVRVDPAGLPSVERDTQVIAGGNAPPLYHMLQILPPEGTTTFVEIVSLQPYGNLPTLAEFSNLEAGHLITTGAKNFDTADITIIPGQAKVHAHNVTWRGFFGGTPNMDMLFSNIERDTTYYFGPSVDYSPFNFKTPNSSSTESFVYRVYSDTYFYTNTRETIVGYIINFNQDVNLSSRIAMYSSENPFDTTDIEGWKNGADVLIQTLSDLTAHPTQKKYYQAWQRKNRSDSSHSTNRGSEKAIMYYVPFDLIPPAITLKYQNALVVDGDTVEIPRLVPEGELFNYASDHTYFNIQTDDPTALIVESNNISNTTVGNYTVTITATDPFLNSSTMSITAAILDREAPEVLSNVFTGAQDSVQLDVTLTEESSVELFQNGLSVQTYSNVTSFTYNATGLPLDVLHTYTANVQDLYENHQIVQLGQYFPNTVIPELFLETGTGTRIFTGATVFLERYSTFTDISATATDDHDPTVPVEITGADPDTTQRHGTTTARTYTATDTAGNSNVAVINFQITDSVVPGLVELDAPAVDTVSRLVTISGEATEECTVGIYRDSARTVLLGSVDTTTGNTFSNSFTESTDGRHSYYLSLFDGQNYTNTYQTTDIYLSDEIYMFDYTGSVQTMTVPAGVSELTVVMWGGGGGPNIRAYQNASNGRPGGQGGFTESKISPVTPGDTVEIVVAGGFNDTKNTASFGGGGPAHNHNGNPSEGYILNESSVGYSRQGGGGGMSNISIGGVTLAVAGGGGGGAYHRGGFGGGGLQGRNELDPSAPAASTAGGGSQTFGGTRAIATADGSEGLTGFDGAFMQGATSNNVPFFNADNGVDVATSAGGGGGGWYGGGSGRFKRGERVTGGGGGSSWLGRDGASILTDSANVWGTTTTFEDTGGRTDTVSGYTYTDSKMLRGGDSISSTNNQLGRTPIMEDHYFWRGSSGSGGNPTYSGNLGLARTGHGYAVLMFT